MGSQTAHRVLWRRASDGQWMTHGVLTFSGPTERAAYRQALAVHRVLDDARLAGRLPLVNALVVRAVDDPDPRWASAKTEGSLGYLFVGRVKGTAKIEAVAKRLGNHLGYHSAEGGWIYDVQGRTVTQGWHSMALTSGWERRGLLVAYRDPIQPGRLRYAVNDLRTVDADKALGPVEAVPAVEPETVAAVEPEPAADTGDLRLAAVRLAKIADACFSGQSGGQTLRRVEKIEPLLAARPDLYVRAREVAARRWMSLGDRSAALLVISRAAARASETVKA